jgi:hypothetical protein
MRSLVSIAFLTGLGAAALVAQTAPPTQAAQKPAAAPKLTGFPFQDETLRYKVLWPSRVSLGDAMFSAHHTQSGWNFEVTLDAGVPGFAVKDEYRSTATEELCSQELDRSFSHGPKKTREKTTFDQRNRTAKRVTVLPPDGGKSDIDIPSCARDALAFVYFARREMGQGRVAPPQTVFFGAGYSVQLQYTGEMTVNVADKPAVTDHVVASIKGPSSSVTAEIFFARDAARTPLLIKVPLSLGTLSVELVR